MKDNNDAIIIGAGIGGLICGCYLAKAGLKVLIVEKNDRPGGCCVSFRKEGFKFDAAAHIIGSCGNNALLGKILKSLGINIDFIRIAPTDRFNFGTDRIDVPVELNDYIKLLQHKFPKESKQIENFFKEILAISSDYIMGQQKLKKYNNAVYQELLDFFFSSNKLKGILSGQCNYLGLPPNQLSAVAMALMMTSYLKDGAFYPLGGAQCFTDAIVKRFREYGGRLLVSTKVNKIILKSNASVKGVYTQSQLKLSSSIVISNIDSRETFFSLIDKSKLNRNFIIALSKYKPSCSFFISHLGVDKTSDELRDKNGWYFNSYNLNKVAKDCLYVFIPTLYDSAIAPDNKSIIGAARIFPYEYNEINDWNKTRKQLEENTIKQLSNIFGNLDNHIIIKASATPLTIEKYIGSLKGAAYGWAMTPKQMYANRLPHKTPLHGLYLVGHWTNPGSGIVSVAISGWNAARTVLFHSNKEKLNNVQVA